MDVVHPEQRVPLDQPRPSTTERLPFTPFDVPLQTVLRTRYLRSVTLWLMGTGEGTVLAQAGNSLWESALTVSVLSDVCDIFEDAQEESQICVNIKSKIPLVARWMLSKRVEESPSEVSWEGVTWDTAVAIRALIIALKKAPVGLSEAEQIEIKSVVRKGVRWLCGQFSKWEQFVKYPFGPADVAQIALALMHLAKEYPEVYREACEEHTQLAGDDDVLVEIIRYLLHKKTEKTLTITTTSGADDVLSYWWDDHFSTAEVVEALALFHEHCQAPQFADDDVRVELCKSVKEALVRACTYFEHDQVDGMWGSHVETLKVVYAYVVIRRAIPQRMPDVNDPLIVPEIHTTFKALRWMCDEKQIFSDGSFLHTMFLTIFYAMALVEVYRSWDPCRGDIATVYDDVVWFSPVRTTPERSRRLAAEIENSDLRHRLDQEQARVLRLREQLTSLEANRTRIIWTSLAALVGIVLFACIGVLLHVTSLQYRIADTQDYLAYLGIVIAVFGAVITVIWKFEGAADHKSPKEPSRERK